MNQAPNSFCQKCKSQAALIAPAYQVTPNIGKRKLVPVRDGDHLLEIIKGGDFARIALTAMIPGRRLPVDETIDLLEVCDLSGKAIDDHARNIIASFLHPTLCDS